MGPLVLKAENIILEDAVKSTNNEGKLEVLDIAEILDFCMAGD